MSIKMSANINYDGIIAILEKSFNTPGEEEMERLLTELIENDIPIIVQDSEGIAINKVILKDGRLSFEVPG